MTDTADRLL